jgi:hypothetical protein
MTRAAFIPHDNQAQRRSGPRIRASETAIKAALKAIRDAGLSVERVCVTGGQVEIHCGPVEGDIAREKDGGLEEW